MNAKEHDQGATPLLMAAYSGLGSVCLRLIERGADVNAKDNQGRTALTLAESSHLRRILEERAPRS